MRTLVLILCLVLPAAALHGDEVILKNGDRFTGSLQKSDFKTLVLKTESAGDLTVNLAGVASFSADGPVFVTVSDGSTISGSVRYSEGKVNVQPEAGGPVTMEVSGIVMLRSRALHEAEVLKYENAGLFDLWSGFVEAGLSLATGTTDTTNFAAGANAVRDAQSNKTSLYFTTIYSSNDIAGESQVTANTIRGGGRYESNLQERFTVFGFSDVEHNEIQNLDVRWVLGGGLGWYLVKNDRTQFQAFGGGAYNHEDFSDDTTRNSGELLFGQNLDLKLSDRVSLAERFVIFPNLSETGEFRMNFDTSLQMKFNDRFGWHLTFSDRYLSNPVPGTGKNDLVFTTGVRFSF